MKRVFLILVLLLGLQACTNITAGVYAGVDLNARDGYQGEPVAIGEVRGNLEGYENVECKYQHRSDWFNGWPLNKNPESVWSELVLCGYTYTFR